LCSFGGKKKFKNGKYGGIVNATWSDTVISIKGPTEKQILSVVIFVTEILQTTEYLERLMTFTLQI